MPYTFDPRLFPMPTLEQGSPFGGVLSNAIAKRLAMAKAQAAEKEVPYAGLSKLAHILSQTAYSSAVGPQFQAKLLGQPGVVANLKNPQQTVNALASYGNIGNASNINDYVTKELMKISANENNNQNSLSDFGKRILGFFGGNNPSETSNQAPTVQAQGNAPVPQTAVPTNNMSQHDAVQYANSHQQGTGAFPVAAQTPTAPQTPSGRSDESVQYGKNWANLNTQTAKGTSQGTKEGTQQAEYGEAAAGVLEQEKAGQNLIKIFKDPTIQDIANVPFATQHSIAWYKQSGTKDQKNKLGEFEAGLNNYVGSSLKMFGPRATDADLRFLQSMKPNDNDTIDVMQGKMVSLKTYNEAKKSQIKLSNDYMKTGMSKADAEFQAASEINMDALRDQAYQNVFSNQTKIDPKDIRIDDIKHTAKELGISENEVISRLNKKGIYLPERPK